MSQWHEPAGNDMPFSNAAGRLKRVEIEKGEELMKPYLQYPPKNTVHSINQNFSNLRVFSFCCESKNIFNSKDNFMPARI